MKMRLSHLKSIDCSRLHKPTVMAWSGSNTEHTCHIIFFLLFIVFMELVTGGIRIFEEPDIDPFTEYGTYGTVTLYIIRYLPLLQLPMAFLSFLGLILFNAFPGKVTLKYPISSAPFICFRVVTRGDFPKMVLDNAYHNLSICRTLGLKKFVIQIVTQAPFPIPENRNIQQLLVPEEYKTRSGIMYKPRSLQYCLEKGINKLKYNDWIVHLDEDTLMTEDSVCGILNFCTEGRHPFGQGTTIYGDNHMGNWLTTMLSSYRVAEDYGKYRLQYAWFDRPLFGYKSGSYLVARVEEEIRLGWDNGLPGSLSDDTYFSMLTLREGYTSGFIEGEMRELPNLIVREHINQRKRWFRGLFLALGCKSIPFRLKVLHYYTLFCWSITPVHILKVIQEYTIQLPQHCILDFLLSLGSAINIYMFIFGTVKQFSVCFPLMVTVIPSVIAVLVFLVPFNLILETIILTLGFKAIIKNENHWNISPKILEPEEKEKTQ